MAKSIKNKQYKEFWEDENLEIKPSESKLDPKVSSEEIKKLEKKLTKKVSGLEKEIKELKEEPKEESKVEEIQPVNKPRGWHAKNEFIDDAGNKFSKGKYVGKVEEPKKPKDEEKEYVEKAKKILKSDGFKEKIQKSVDKVIPDIQKEEFKDIKPIPPVEEKIVIENMVKEEVISKPILITPPKVLTDKDIYQQHINDNVPFKMFFRGNLIFDSKVQPLKNYPIFQDDGFILFGKNYIYRGIRIEKY